MLRVIIIIASLLITISCKEQSTIQLANNAQTIEYAKWFKISEGEGYKLLEIVNPWDTTTMLGSYVLVPKSNSLPATLPSGVVVRTPVERVVVFSGVDAGVIDFIGEGSKISGVCDGKYFSTPSIKERIESGDIVDLGMSNMPSIEKLIAIRPELIIVSPYQNSDFGAIEKMKIPVVKSVSYMENTPLGQSQWICFLAEFFNKSQLAEEQFTQIVSRYNSAKEIVNTVGSPKTLLPGKRYGASWHVAAGNSYMANIYKDAKANYPWASNNTTGSLSLSFEEVLSKAKGADIWVITYNNTQNEMNYDQLKSEFANYVNFDAFKNRKVFGCNSATTPIFERALLTPDLLLSDYIKMLYPEIMEHYNFTFFKPIATN